MRALQDCKYTAFISYAHADDETWFRWVTHFRNELDRGLATVRRRMKLPPMHLSGDNGPVAGMLGEQLKQRIEESFAMIIVVHDNYAQSDWCLKELEYFRTLFGDDGFRDRLYVVAISEPAMSAVAGGSAWRRLMPGNDQLWMPFFDPRASDRPLDIYMAPEVLAPAFRDQFLRLREDFEAKLLRAVAPPSGGALGPRPAPPEARRGTNGAAPAAAVDIPIGRVPPPPAAAPRPAGVTVLGFVPSGPTAQALSAVADRLRAAGVELRMLAQDAVFDDFAAFAGAERLVLAFDDEPPMMAAMAQGGHLQLQREAWLRKGGAPDRVHWLDLRAAPAAAAPEEGSAAAYVAGQASETLDAAALLRLLAPPPPAAAAGSAGAAAAPSRGVRIYIESNTNSREVNLWLPLGQQIRRTWNELTRRVDPARVPPLALSTRGLPVDRLDRFPTLDDADGIVLLWGHKDEEALLAQIDKVERKTTPGSEMPPGIVAYLMPPQQSAEPVPAWGWQVLRFDAQDQAAIDVVADERDQLQGFLTQVLARWQQREQGG